MGLEKITLTEKVVSEKKKEIGLGDKGDLVLVHKKRKNKSYRLGKFSNADKNNYETNFIEFENGESYFLKPRNIYGSIVPNMIKVQTSLRSSITQHCSIDLNTKIIFGKENIIDYLENKSPKEYSVFVDLIRGMK